MVVTVFILLYHVYMYTSLFVGIRNSKLVTNIGNRLTLKPEPQTNENCQLSIMNPIRGYDDTIDILVSDADRYSTDNTGSTTEEEQHQTTETVLVIG